MFIYTLDRYTYSNIYIYYAICVYIQLPCRLDSELLLRSQSKSESSYSLTSLTERESHENNNTTHLHPNPFAQIVDCTASDLFPKRARHEMFSAISAPQTWVPDQNRDR